MKKLFTSLLLLTQSVVGFTQITSTFESLPLDQTGYWIGADKSGGFTDGNAYFKNNYSTEYGDGYWEGGFAYSNHTDVTTAGFTNQYSVYTGSGVGHSGKFAIGKDQAIVQLKNEAKKSPVTGFYVANTTYAVLDMKNGTPTISKKFGGASGNDPDYFQLAITGFRNNAVISDTVKIKLADYTFTDNAKDYILDRWKWVDLRPLGVVDSLIFLLTSSDNGNFGMNTPNYFAIDHFNEPLYDVAVADGSTQALSKDDLLFKSWANAAAVTRGYQDIAVGGALANVGTDDKATLKADGSVVSLGDNGVAILEFQYPVMNGAGPDFAVFENGFNNFSGPGQFLELAFVEVSSDGINYVRFPTVSKTNSLTQIGSFGYTDAALLHNLAGKYVSGYGTPFDLDELKNNTLIDVNNITHVKIIDVIGSVNSGIATKDSLGNPVNDPYPTAFGSGGFDLDAVGVINQNALSTSVKNTSVQIIQVYPNPSSNTFNISLLNQSYVGEQLTIFDSNGILMADQIVSGKDIIDASSWNNGIYYIRVGNTTQKIIKID
ncbi:DUF4465 domain-containing protein [Cytophaga hutchinsonii]|uniref:Secretion system C-terminal sorting domain-containing protein n=1 Tax=Cytophaga hutchinsonii (strain ATCC 33406 / DSM 1761 / CIP 103989 / NBRC 15051 / NCIMB 9469 / D465) TaxID=269798 RepID=A0A6N4SRF1_CYTH3|nr:DUF4465 domain-containing protein [Cytophaga hutchinsonii]ABG58878.1 conserved hypothetical protein [Cytophaga hutchinsonii ATCC 33406]SFX81188.1 Por secretion system C-terminal sorting domain-containing protein [Cytophaga hutchinsonii ATCC 33406]